LVTQRHDDGSYEEAGASHRKASPKTAAAYVADWGLYETVHLFEIRRFLTLIRETSPNLRIFRPESRENMSGAAQREEMTELTYSATGTHGPLAGSASAPAALKQLAVERLAAHRNRKAELQAQEDQLKADLLTRRLDSRRGASRVRDAVAARYQSSVSYHEFLAAEAERAFQQAQAEAEIAARNARAVAEAKLQLMQELEQWNRHEPKPHATSETRPETPTLLSLVETALPEVFPQTYEQPSPLSYKVRLYEELASAPPSIVEVHHSAPAITSPDTLSELQQLEEEIAFRLSPEFVHHSLETTAIPANIIEFPRQLVAPRKARPRLAEGPLREESEPQPQLRIFEVEPEQISAEPVELTPAPEWQSLQLGASVYTPEPATSLDAQLNLAIPPQTAPLELRLMAAAVDAACIAASFIAFATAAAFIAGHHRSGLPLPLLGATAAGSLLIIFLLYQMLFFPLADATPGMRYARLGLCTFADANPTRRAMRMRVLAKLLAACPLGLGLAWAALDDERLGWHDRMSRMYPRAY